MSRELSILVTARNLSSRVLGGVKRDINGVEGAARRAGSNMGRNIGIGVAAVGAGLAIQVRAGVESLVELERVENLTASALESTGNVARQSAEGIRARAEAMENLTGVDDKVVQNAQNLLLTFTNVTEDAFEPTLEAALNLNAALGGNDESLQGVLLQVAKAVNDPVRGMTALRRSGVSFTEAEQDQVKAMVEANDLMGAQALILGSLETQFGGAAEAANQGVGASQKKFADAIEDMQMALATGFLPLIQRVSEKMQTLIADPAFLTGVESFGEAIAGGFDAAINFAEGVPWGAVGAALQTMGTGARMAMDAFLSAPPWLQTAILTGWGLNKLTGGGLGSVVGALGSGLIKGVLGMNAGVVNINAATVTGGGSGGLPVGGGGRGGVGGLATSLLKWGVAPLAAAFAGGQIGNAIIEPQVAPSREATVSSIEAIIAGGDMAQIQNALRAVRDGLDTSGTKIEDLPKQLALAMDAGGLRSTLEAQEALLTAALGEHKNGNAITKTTAAAQRSVDAAMLNSARTEVGIAFTQRRLAEAAAGSDRAMLTSAAAQAQRLAAIQGLEAGNSGKLSGILAKKTAVNVTVPLSISISATVVQQQLTELRRSVGGGGFI